MTTPQLTVFTPFLRPNAHYFDGTINSVLSQSFADFEYLMINNGPAEDTARIERSFRDSRIRILTRTGLQLSASRDAGLHEARTEFIAFIDADDLCEPDRFLKQIEFLRAHPDHVLVGSALRYIDEQSNTIGGRRYPETDEAIKARLVAMNCIAQPSVMARRQSLIDAGGYTEESARWAEDYALWLRLARHGKFHNLAEPLVAYRIHAGATKARWVRSVLRDSTRLKIRAIRHYGFKPTPRALASIAGHAVLLALPGRVVYWLFRRLFVR